jgi:hypothetical protein
MYRSRLATPATLGHRVGIVARFWAHVHCHLADEQCWLWRGRLDRNAEPVLHFPGGSVSAARLAWFVVLGEFPLAGGTYRRCGNARCVRPTHLRWKVSSRARAAMEAIHGGVLRHTGSPTVGLERRAALRAGAVRAEPPGLAAS